MQPVWTGTIEQQVKTQKQSMCRKVVHNTYHKMFFFVSFAGAVTPNPSDDTSTLMCLNHVIQH